MVQSGSFLLFQMPNYLVQRLCTFLSNWWHGVRSYASECLLNVTKVERKDYSFTVRRVLSFSESKTCDVEIPSAVEFVLSRFSPQALNLHWAYQQRGSGKHGNLASFVSKDKRKGQQAVVCNSLCHFYLTNIIIGISCFYSLFTIRCLSVTNSRASEWLAMKWTNKIWIFQLIVSVLLSYSFKL